MRISHGSSLWAPALSRRPWPCIRAATVGTSACASIRLIVTSPTSIKEWISASVLDVICRIPGLTAINAFTSLAWRRITGKQSADRFDRPDT